MPHATGPRIPPLSLEEMDAQQRTLARLGADTVVRVLAHNPDLLGAFQPLGGYLLSQGLLNPRIRELAILRVALRCDAPYEWANHVPAALGGGATSAEIDALSDPSASWEAADDAVLRAVDELCADVFVSDETWEALTATRGHPEILELLFLVGFYRMMAGVLNSAGVQPTASGGRLGGSTPAPSPQVPSPQAPNPQAPDAPGAAGEASADGTWNITLEHPAGSKDIIVTLRTVGADVTGSLFDTMLDVTVPITAGTVDGQHLRFTAQVTDPVRFDLLVEGTVTGDRFIGTVTISGGGTFPFSGNRAPSSAAGSPR